MATWEIELTDLSGSGLAAAPIPLSLAVSKQRNGAMTLAISVHVEDAAAGLLTPGTTLVKGYRTNAAGVRTIRFHGTIWQRDESLAAGSGIIEITAVDSWATLERRFTTASYSSTDQGLIIKGLVDTANSDNETRIATSTAYVTTTKSRVRSWADERTPVSEAVFSFTELLDPVDVELIPIEYAAGKICNLFVYDRQGSTTPLATFGYGVGTEANLESVTRSTTLEEIATTVQAFGAGGKSRSATDATQQAALGKYVSDLSLASVVESATLIAHAQDELARRKHPLRTLDLVPSINAPILWDDVNIGDEVYVHAAAGGVSFVETARIMAAEITVDESGVEKWGSLSVEVEQ